MILSDVLKNTLGTFPSGICCCPFVSKAGSLSHVTSYKGGTRLWILKWATAFSVAVKGNWSSPRHYFFHWWWNKDGRDVICPVDLEANKLWYLNNKIGNLLVDSKNPWAFYPSLGWKCTSSSSFKAGVQNCSCTSTGNDWSTIGVKKKIHWRERLPLRIVCLFMFIMIV